MSEEEGNSSESSSSESSSESDEDLVEDIPDKDFFKALSCLKTKDPRIYDQEVTFFTEKPLIIKRKNKHDLAGNASLLSEDKRNFNTINSNNSRTNNKFSLKDLDNESSSEDEFLGLKKSSNEPQQKIVNEDENEYIQFLKGRKAILEDKQVEQELKPLQKYWNTEVLDENEQFLRDYILNKKYLAPQSEVNVDNEDLSEDERELEEQAEYEANYNFRFETGENLQLKRFPRNIEGSMRRKNDARSKKRAEMAQRKKEEKAKKFQDVKKKQKQKLSEIEERLQKLKELTGNVELGFKDEEILEDFDPEKHDQKMKELFNEDYYNEEENEHPVFNENDDYWENDDIEMDCEEVEKSKKLTRTQKKKLRKKKTYKDIMDIAKPSFDPKVHNDFKKYIDEYYSLDCEDFIDDIPCKFKYREVVPNDYGLSIEEILMADDSELNRWASVKKICKRRPEHVEKNEVNIYKKKAQDESLKKTILKSLYSEPTDQLNDNFKDNHDISKNNNSKTKYSEAELEQGKMELSDSENPEKHNSGENIKLTDNNHQMIQTSKDNAKKKKKKRKHKQILNENHSSAQQISLNTDNGTNQTHTNKKCKALDDSSTLTNENVCEENTTKDIMELNERCNEHENKVTTGLHDQLQNIATNSQKKKRRRKKKKNVSIGNSTGENSINTNNEGSIKNQNETKMLTNDTPTKSKSKKIKNVKFKNKLKNKFGFKKNKNNIVNLSDSRLQAYGIKPKTFRAKMQYSQRNSKS